MPTTGKSSRSHADLFAYWRAVGIDPDRCYYTGWPLGGAGEMDHLMPLARGGIDTLDNLVPCLPAVKQAKNLPTAAEFLAFLDSTDPELGVAV